MRKSLSSSAAALPDADRYELAHLEGELEDLPIKEVRDARYAEDAERWELRINQERDAQRVEHESRLNDES